MNGISVYIFLHSKLYFKLDKVIEFF